MHTPPSLWVLLLAVVCQTATAGEITALPDKVPCAVTDRQNMQIPDRVHLSGMVGERMHRSEANRLQMVDAERLLEGYRKRPGRQNVGWRARRKMAPCSHVGMGQFRKPEAACQDGLRCSRAYQMPTS